MILHWNVDPVLLHLGGFELRYYGLLFAAGFYIASIGLGRMFSAEGRDPKDLDVLLGYTIFGVVVGARLVHCLFYEPGFYLSHPLEILKVWKGGLASHGGVMGVFAAVYWFSRKKGYSFLWLLDRASIWAALGGALIRLGNLFNSEIVGQPTGGDWGLVFERVDQLPRHPTALYEAACYLLVYAVTHALYTRSKDKRFGGRLFGLAMFGVFAARAVIEGLKENQAAFEADMWLNMGQLLSLPFMALALFLMLRRNTR
ncbi:MAG: prolipoprotein diacylglyceryl transferase [bacterium]|nr:prolipoprotein diacylglyceryl transferase [bacterium]